MIVQFKETIDKKMFEQLKMSAVDEHLQQDLRDKPIIRAIRQLNPEIVRKQIFELALQHNLNIVSLQSESQSLEDVFQVL